MKFVQILLFNVFLFISGLVFADIQVSLDRNPVHVNESFQIIFTATSQPDGEPDFTPLQDNFEILDQQRSSNSSWINGRSSRNEKWILTAMAKQAGEILIPPISFGSELSKPLQVNVSQNQTAPQSHDDIFLEVSVSTDKPYLQSQVIYTLKLYHHPQLLQGKLEEPQLKDAVIEKLADDSKYDTQINGVDYTVITRKYAIFPQQAGQVTIPALNLTAEVMTQRRPVFNGFFNQQSTEVKRVVSKAITLNVLPAPTEYKDNAWLPADAVELNQDWSDNQLQIKVGEPLTRTLHLTAKGTTVGQLPELSSSTSIDSLKTYPDQPVLKEDKLDDGLTASREEKIAYIPSKPGDYSLPAIEINWFNTQTRQMSKTTLPGVTIHAIANTETNVQPTQTPIETPSNSIVTTVDTGQVRLWQAISAFLAFAWLLTGFAYYRLAKNHPEKTVTLSKKIKATETDLTADLNQACQENNAQLANESLLAWGKQHYAVDNLISLAGFCSPELSQEIQQLNANLYSGQHQNWQGAALWQAFSTAPKPKVSLIKAKDLPC